MTDPTPDLGGLLRPYLPRLAIEWLRESSEDRSRESEGSVVFVDISGFTKMSERLAKRGKVGAEEVTDNLGGVFTRMLAVAYGEDGSLLKFGGDALLLWFGGPGHVERAVRSAFGMRGTLRRFGTLETSAGKVTLRMSVGVHSGTFQFFLVGRGSHREFLMTGPAASRTVQMENAAEAGDILLSPEICALLDPAVVGREKGPGRLLKREPGGLASQAAPPPDADGVDVSFGVPLAVREHVVQGAADPEHRQVTVAFIHFEDVDAFIRDHGLAATAEALDELVTDVQEAADAHGVTFLSSDVDRDGGKIILIAGAPRANVDDDERMLLTLRQIASRTRRLPARIGVNRGHVFVGEVGPAYRRTYTVMGDAVNLAARVMTKAEPGQVLATAPVLDRSKTKFGTTALEPFMVKGKAKPVDAFVVGEVLRARAVAEDVAPFTGRAAELAAIGAHVDLARRGAGRLVQIVGDPGLGKSRLLEEALAAATGFAIHRGSCQSFAAHTPYFPFMDPVRDLLGVALDASDEVALTRLREVIAEQAPDLEPWIPLLAVLLDARAEDTPETTDLLPEFRPVKLAQVLGALLRRLLTAPTIWAIEDAHWMDEPSCHLLDVLGGGLTDVPWLWLITRRDVTTGFVPGEDVAAIALPELDEAEATSLARSVTEHAPLASHAMTAVLERAGGNPLFLQELIRSVRAAGGDEDLPDSVEALLTAEIDRLPARERTLLRCAAVLGPAFDRDFASSVLAEELSDAGDDAWRGLAGFLLEGPEGDVRFSSALLRDAAYEGLPFRRRKAIHGRVGEAIEASAPDPEDAAETLSFHYFHSDEPARSWHFSRVAGDRAEWIYANAEATEFFRRALATAKAAEAPPTDVIEVGTQLGLVLQYATRYEEALAAFRAARRVAAKEGDHLAEATILFKEANSVQFAGGARVLRGLRRAFTALEGVAGTAAAALRAEIAVAYAYKLSNDPRRHRECLRWCEEARRWAEESGSRVAEAQIAQTLTWTYTTIGDPQRGPDPTLALSIFEELGLLGGQQAELIGLGFIAQTEGRWDEAIEYNDRAVAIGKRRGDVDMSTAALHNNAEIVADQGRVEEADETFREILRTVRANRFTMLEPYALGNLGRCAARLGRHDEAADLLEQARRGFEEAGDPVSAVEMEAKMAENLVLRGEGTAALALATQTQERADAMGAWALVTALVRRAKAYALAQVGRLEDADAAFVDAEEVARGGDVLYEVGLALQGRGRIASLRGEAEEATECAERAEEIFDGLGVERTPEVPLETPAPSPATSP